MNLEKWIRPIIVAMLFGAFLTGQSRHAMAEETEAETAPPSAVMSARPLEENRIHPKMRKMVRRLLLMGIRIMRISQKAQRQRMHWQQKQGI